MQTEEGVQGASRKKSDIRVAIVGVCGSGKSALAEALRAQGYKADPVAQEHSLVANLFLHKEPDFVIYLDAEDGTVSRRKKTGWEPSQLQLQRERLKMARDRADLRFSTDEIALPQLLEKTIAALKTRF